MKEKKKPTPPKGEMFCTTPECELRNFRFHADLNKKDEEKQDV